MLFNGRTLIFTFSRTQVRIAEIERLQSLFKTSMVVAVGVCQTTWVVVGCSSRCVPDNNGCCGL